MLQKTNQPSNDKVPISSVSFAESTAKVHPTYLSRVEAKLYIQKVVSQDPKLSIDSFYSTIPSKNTIGR